MLCEDVRDESVLFLACVHFLWSLFCDVQVHLSVKTCVR